MRRRTGKSHEMNFCVCAFKGFQAFIKRCVCCLSISDFVRQTLVKFINCVASGVKLTNYLTKGFVVTHAFVIHKRENGLAVKSHGIQHINCVHNFTPLPYVHKFG